MKATNNTEDLRRIITRRREQALDRSDFISLTVRLAVVVLAGWVLFTQVFLITQASGSAMFPSVKDGDLLIGFRLQQTYQKGDVVIYHQDGNIRVGRICANSTDYVDIDEEGALYYIWKVDGNIAAEGENIHTLEYSFPVFGRSYSE